MPSFTLSLLDAKHLAAALIPHIGTDDVTPVLTGAMVEGQYAYATDRYTVGRFDLTNMLLHTDAVGERIWVPRAALAWVKTIGKMSLRWDEVYHYQVRFTYLRHEKGESMDSFRVEVIFTGWDKDNPESEVHLLRTFTSKGARGNFPPVTRLLDMFLPGPQVSVGIGPVQIEKFTTYARWLDRGAPIRVTMPSAEGGVSSSSKLQPFLVEVGSRFKGLLQPNLILNSAGFGPDLAQDNLDKHNAEVGKRADTKPADTEGGE